MLVASELGGSWCWGTSSRTSGVLESRQLLTAPPFVADYNSFASRFLEDTSGLILSFRDTDVLLVVRMEPDSAAVRSGLLEGDRVLLFDGKSPKDTSMRAMRKRLTEAGTTVKLNILRDGKELDIDLPLSRSYEYPPKWPELNTDADDFFKSLQNEKKPAAE